MEDDDLRISKVELSINKEILLSMLIVVGISIIISGCLAYIFSDSIITILCSLIIGTTIGILFNYFILSTNKIVKQINIETVENQDIEDSYTIMKIE
jgi:hypothetical protein